MMGKPKKKTPDKSQRERFVEAAKAAGASSNPDDFERVFARLVPRRSSRRVKRTSG
jgi:hypothetical protein